LNQELVCVKEEDFISFVVGTAVLCIIKIK